MRRITIGSCGVTLLTVWHPKNGFKPKIGNHIAQQKERQQMWQLATCRQKREMRPPTGGSPHTLNTPKISHLRLDAEVADQTEVPRPQAAPLPRTGRRKPRPRARKDWTRPREEKEVADRKTLPTRSVTKTWLRYSAGHFSSSLVHRNIWIYPIEKLPKEKKLPVPGDSNSRWDIHTVNQT